jgi:hypothetical protein
MELSLNQISDNAIHVSGFDVKDAGFMVLGAVTQAAAVLFHG